MSFISNISNMAVSGFWKAGSFVIAGFAAVSSAYLGYHWHQAADARDTAVTERTKAEGERDDANKKLGTCSGALSTQNKSVQEHADETKAAKDRLTVAEKKNADYEKRVKALTLIPKSTTCAEATSRVRKTVESLRDVKEQP